MLILAKSLPNPFSVTPNHDDYKKEFARTSTGSSFHLKSSPRTHLLSPNSGCSFAVVRASASVAKPTSHGVMDYNARICHFCEVGNLKNAMELLCRSPKSELELKTYCSVLELCAESKSVQEGKRVHSVICGNGVPVDENLGAKLVFMYVNCGDLREGRRVFDKIPSDRVFLWNLMINEYAKVRNFKESVSLFKKMQQVGVQANSHTLSCILKCFAALRNVKEGERVHACLCKMGFGSYNTVMNSLMAFYFKSGRVENAQKVFDELSDRDVISWNSMISGYAANGLGEKGVETFIEMLCLGLKTDLATTVNVLVACADIGTCLLGKAVHGYAIKACFDREIRFLNTLLDMYSKCGDLAAAVQVFEKMGKKSVVSWTSMMAGHVRKGLSDEAIKIFYEMQTNGISPDIFTVTSILHACACCGSLENGKVVHNYIRENDMESNLFVCNALMDMYAKCGSMEDAHLVFSGMPVKDIVSWNTMIGGYSQNCLPNDALKLFSEMQQNSKPDSITVACILPACASLAALDRGREIHGYILRNGYFQDQIVANALVDMYAKSGLLALAQILFDMIPTKDLISWTVMIAGYGMHGFGTEAIAAFNEMRDAGIEPDEVSFISILHACSHSGLLDEGWRFFNIMRNECNIEPGLEHYACIVDLLSRTGNLSKAYKFIRIMPIKPDATIWGALLCGCRIYHDVKLAEKVAEHVFELEPENTGYYVLLANIYAEAEKWEEVKKLRERMGRKGLKKNPGCSWIEIKGKVNIFVSADGSHPLANQIESLLKRLRAKMQEEGFFPNLKYALINADDMEKEVALCGHSEKLAMAFGMLSLPPGKTIRVTKNLRVCGDCHETAKFISKTSRREIMLRDSNRFHHFKDGHCSCRGFW
ncbi:DYW domain containing protein [Trema orientale]|uniref:DYW domain containing protein n=1 Tax=Trema orientale TaxID=63057 RepID=A0A2P5EP25_TREOI|nr:DYW domain containing protein [Trema orientale]